MVLSYVIIFIYFYNYVIYKIDIAISETPIMPDTADEQFDADLLNSVKPAELHPRM